MRIVYRPVSQFRVRRSWIPPSKAAGGTLFFQSLTGSVAFSGTLTKQTGKITAGSLATITGTITKQTGKILAGVFEPTGVLVGIKTVLTSLTGAVTFAGSLTKLTSKVLSGGFTPTGSLVKRTSKAFTGAVTFAGNLIRQHIVPGAGEAINLIAGSVRLLGNRAAKVSLLGYKAIVRKFNAND